MLAQNFKTPTALGISDIEFESLVKVLGMLERGEIEKEQFDMRDVWHPCGAPACLIGWAGHVSGRELFTGRRSQDLFLLFASRRATPAQAAIALRNYLTTGEANWAEALAE